MFQNDIENILMVDLNNFKYGFVKDDKAIWVIYVNLLN